MASGKLSSKRRHKLSAKERQLERRKLANRQKKERRQLWLD